MPNLEECIRIGKEILVQAAVESKLPGFYQPVMWSRGQMRMELRMTPIC